MASTLAPMALRAPVALRSSSGARKPARASADPASSAASRSTFAQRASATATGVALAPAAFAPALRVSRRAAVITKAAKDEDSSANISKKVQRTANACKTLGRWGFWSQLILSTVSAVILVFSFLFKGITKANDAGLYFILFGIICGYFTTFWSLGIGKLGGKLQAAVTQLDLVPPRTEVVRQLSTGLTINFVGLGATIIGLQATTGILFAKSLTAAAASPFQPGGYNPVLALDIFLVQAGSNVMFAHWIGAAVSLWLLRTVNLPTPQAR